MATVLLTVLLGARSLLSSPARAEDAKGLDCSGYSGDDRKLCDSLTRVLPQVAAVWKDSSELPKKYPAIQKEFDAMRALPSSAQKGPPEPLDKPFQLVMNSMEKWPTLEDYELLARLGKNDIAKPGPFRAVEDRFGVNWDAAANAFVIGPKSATKAGGAKPVPPDVLRQMRAAVPTSAAADKNGGAKGNDSGASDPDAVSSGGDLSGAALDAKFDGSKGLPGTALEPPGGGAGPGVSGPTNSGKSPQTPAATKPQPESAPVSQTQPAGGLEAPGKESHGGPGKSGLSLAEAAAAALGKLPGPEGAREAARRQLYEILDREMIEARSRQTRDLVDTMNKRTDAKIGTHISTKAQDDYDAIKKLPVGEQPEKLKGWLREQDAHLNEQLDGMVLRDEQRATRAREKIKKLAEGGRKPTDSELQSAQKELDDAEHQRRWSEEILKKTGQENPELEAYYRELQKHQDLRRQGLRDGLVPDGTVLTPLELGSELQDATFRAATVDGQKGIYLEIITNPQRKMQREAFDKGKDYRDEYMERSFMSSDGRLRIRYGKAPDTFDDMETREYLRKDGQLDKRVVVTPGGTQESEIEYDEQGEPFGRTERESKGGKPTALRHIVFDPLTHKVAKSVAIDPGDGSTVLNETRYLGDGKVEFYYPKTGILKQGKMQPDGSVLLASGSIEGTAHKLLFSGETGMSVEPAYDKATGRTDLKGLVDARLISAEQAAILTQNFPAETLAEFSKGKENWKLTTPPRIMFGKDGPVMVYEAKYYENGRSRTVSYSFNQDKSQNGWVLTQRDTTKLTGQEPDTKETVEVYVGWMGDHFGSKQLYKEFAYQDFKPGGTADDVVTVKDSRKSRFVWDSAAKGWKFLDQEDPKPDQITLLNIARKKFEDLPGVTHVSKAFGALTEASRVWGFSIAGGGAQGLAVIKDGLGMDSYNEKTFAAATMNESAIGDPMRALHDAQFELGRDGGLFMQDLTERYRQSRMSQPGLSPTQKAAINGSNFRPSEKELAEFYVHGAGFGWADASTEFAKRAKEAGDTTTSVKWAAVATVNYGGVFVTDSLALFGVGRVLGSAAKFGATAARAGAAAETGTAAVAGTGVAATETAAAAAQQTSRVAQLMGWSAKGVRAAGQTGEAVTAGAGKVGDVQQWLDMSASAANGNYVDALALYLGGKVSHGIHSAMDGGKPSVHGEEAAAPTEQPKKSIWNTDVKELIKGAFQGKTPQAEAPQPKGWVEQPSEPGTSFMEEHADKPRASFMDDQAEKPGRMESVLAAKPDAPQPRKLGSSEEYLALLDRQDKGEPVDLKEVARPGIASSDGNTVMIAQGSGRFEKLRAGETADLFVPEGQPLPKGAIVLETGVSGKLVEAANLLSSRGKSGANPELVGRLTKGKTFQRVLVPREAAEAPLSALADQKQNSVESLGEWAQAQNPQIKEKLGSVLESKAFKDASLVEQTEMLNGLEQARQQGPDAFEARLKGLGPEPPAKPGMVGKVENTLAGEFPKVAKALGIDAPMSDSAIRDGYRLAIEEARAAGLPPVTPENYVNQGDLADGTRLTQQGAALHHIVGKYVRVGGGEAILVDPAHDPVLGDFLARMEREAPGILKSGGEKALMEYVGRSVGEKIRSMPESAAPLDVLDGDGRLSRAPDVVRLGDLMALPQAGGGRLDHGYGVCRHQNLLAHAVLESLAAEGVLDRTTVISRSENGHYYTLALGAPGADGQRTSYIIDVTQGQIKAAEFGDTYFGTGGRRQAIRLSAPSQASSFAEGGEPWMRHAAREAALQNELERRCDADPEIQNLLAAGAEKAAKLPELQRQIKSAESRIEGALRRELESPESEWPGDLRKAFDQELSVQRQRRAMEMAGMNDALARKVGADDAGDAPTGIFKLPAVESAETGVRLARGEEVLKEAFEADRNHRQVLGTLDTATVEKQTFEDCQLHSLMNRLGLRDVSTAEFTQRAARVLGVPVEQLRAEGMTAPQVHAVLKGMGLQPQGFYEHMIKEDTLIKRLGDNGGSMLAGVPGHAFVIVGAYETPQGMKYVVKNSGESAEGQLQLYSFSGFKGNLEVMSVKPSGLKPAEMLRNLDAAPRGVTATEFFAGKGSEKGKKTGGTDPQIKFLDKGDRHPAVSIVNADKADYPHEVKQAREFGALLGGGKVEFIGGNSQGIEGYFTPEGGAEKIPFSFKDMHKKSVSDTKKTFNNIRTELNKNAGLIKDGPYKDSAGKAIAYVDVSQMPSGTVAERIKEGVDIKNLPKPAGDENLYGGILKRVIFHCSDGVVEVTDEGVRTHTKHDSNP